MADDKTSSMLPVGARLNGRYRVERHLASGGFGNTYCATTDSGARVAIKEFFLKGVNHRDGDSTTVSVSNSENCGIFDLQMAKFRKEAERLRGLHSDHIVKVLDFFDENGTSYYVMEFIAGESLSRRLKRTGALPEGEVRDILRQVLDALATVHAAGLYHLDIKPANIMLDGDRAVLIDFGASKQTDAATGGATAHTQAAYTKGYAPLEQVEGDMTKVGPWTDLYALGATLYQLLTNADVPSSSDITDRGKCAFNFPDGVSEQMRDLVAWMMKPARSDRPKSVIEVSTKLYGEVAAVTAVATPKKATGTDAGVTVIKESAKGKKGKDKATSATSAQKKGAKSQQKTGQGAPQKKTNSSNNFSISIIIGAILALLIVGLFVYLSRTSGTESATTVENDTISTGFGLFVYSGPIDSIGQPDGIGCGKFLNGDIYNGPFVHGIANGDNAIYRFKDGTSFVGSMKNNKFNEGKYTHSDQSQFEGKFRNNQPYSGTWRTPDGKIESKMENGRTVSYN